MKPLKTTAIPEISYSSSEDEDFFDAEEDDDDDDEVSDMTEMRTPPPQPPTTLDLSAVALESSINDINSPLTPVEGKFKM